jgi:hypothetical protein
VNPRLDRSRRLFPVVLGIVTLACVGLLLAQDFLPGLSPAWNHASLAAFALAMIAVAYLIYELAHRPAPLELVKAVLLAAAFLFWAANQYWPNLPQAALFNDIAIALFVFDVFLVIAGWPPASRDPSFAEMAEENCLCCCHRADDRSAKTLRS